MKSTSVRFTKIRSYYFPVTADDYKLMRAHGIPLIRIHENMMPTLGLVFKRHKIKPELQSFRDTILEPFLDRLGAGWQAKEHRRATINRSWMKFETTHSSIQPQGRDALYKVEATLRRFFTRWGFSASFEVSENRGKLKLHVQYRFDPERNPVIPLAEDHTVVPSVKLDLGFVRLTLLMFERDVEINVSLAAGTDWKSIHTSRCKYEQVSDVRHFISALADVANKDPHNADNKAT